MTGLTPEPKSPELLVPAGILKSRAALRRDLPVLLADRRTRGKWACYSGETQIGIGTDYFALVDEVVRRGISDGEFVIERLAPGAGSDEDGEIESRNV